MKEEVVKFVKAAHSRNISPEVAANVSIAISLDRIAGVLGDRHTVTLLAQISKSLGKMAGEESP